MINQNLLLGDEGYNIQRSLRFRSSASAYLSRTPSSTTNRRTWTWSGWVKRGALGSVTRLFSADNGAQQTLLRFQADNTLQFQIYNSAITAQIITTQVFRDPSAWYHIVAVLDTTDATSSNRMKLYVNGSQITALGTATYPTQNYDAFVNQNILHSTSSAGTSEYWDGYLTEINFIDGQALTPSSFGQTNPATGVWQPIKYSGTYGTNGFYLNFSDNSSNTATTIGKDYSGNGNNWTPNNISVTSGATYDSMTDVPTLTSATASNFCTWNPIFVRGNEVISDGNLQLATGTTGGGIGTIGVTTGKWYWESINSASSGTVRMIGIINLSRYTNSLFTNSLYWQRHGAYTLNNAADVSYGSAAALNDVLGIALDVDAQTVIFYNNGVALGSAISISSMYTAGEIIVPAMTQSGAASRTAVANFGQRPFAYTPPTGFVALNTFNLPTPTIGATSSSLANKYMNVVTYTGTGSSQSITGVGFQPDWTWIKGRSGATDHGLYDAVRGVQKQLESNNTDAETTETTGLTAFGSDGFTVGALAQLNTSSATYVGWNWKANGSGSSNTAGSITSTVSANTTAGFSIVTYTGTNVTGTIGHGLGVAPKMLIVKRRNSTSDWGVYHSSLGSNNGLFLNLTDASTTPAPWNNTAPTSSVFTVATGSFLNVNTATYVAYCFAEVAGYSAFGSYTGNGSTDGPFVFTGFRPKYVLIKRTDSAEDWIVMDSARNTFNVANSSLFPNGSFSETTDSNRQEDFLSNGFKIRSSGVWLNANGGTFIYAAFAENPLKYSLAR